jgi:GT2 family glycosyltransferase
VACVLKLLSSSEETVPEPSDLPWQIRHIDLAEAVVPLDAGAPVAGIMVVFWWKDVPLGQSYIPAERLPFSGGALRVLASELATMAIGDRLYEEGFNAQLPEYAPQPRRPTGIEPLAPPENPFMEAADRVHRLAGNRTEMSTSVIICTRDRPDDLRTCLQSLTRLEELPTEVIIVDNAPKTDSTRRVVDDAAGGSLPLRYVLEEQPGLSTARNAGITAAGGDIIAFTDDDVQVHPAWLSRLCAGFTSEDVMAVTGLILPSELETTAQQMFQWNHGGYSWSFRPLEFDGEFFERTRWRGTPVWHIGAGASMAFRSDVFTRLGGFDERLGAGASGCSEDSELWYRILAGGGVCRYEPSSVVFHTHRRSMDGLERQLHDYMQGHVTALFAHFERSKHPGDLLRAGFWLPRYYGGWILRRMLGRKGGPSLLDAQVRGFLNGFAYYARNRNAPSAPSFSDRSPSAKK